MSSVYLAAATLTARLTHAPCLMPHATTLGRCPRQRELGTRHSPLGTFSGNKNAAFRPRFNLGTICPSRPSGSRCREREVASAIVHGGTPIRPLFRGWVRGGRDTEGSRSTGRSRFSKNPCPTKKGPLRPLVAVPPARVCFTGCSLHLSVSLSSDFHHVGFVLYQSALICV